MGVEGFVPATVIKGEKMMLLRFWIHCISYSVLFPSALTTVQMVTSTTRAQNQASYPTAQTTLSKAEMDKMEEIKALSCVLATVARVLDKREEKLKKQITKIGIHADIDRRAPIAFNEVDLCTVQKEMELLALGQRRNGCRVIANLDYFLIRSHVKYKKLKKKYKKLKKSYPDYLRQYSRHLVDIDVNIHDLLRRRGLHRTMSAVLRGGATLADVASDRKIPSGKPFTLLPQSVNVLLSTKHWRDEESWCDFSLTGQIGIVPILAVISSPKDTDKTNVALHESGLIYEAQFNANSQLSNSSEASLFIGAGQTRLWDRDANIDSVQLVENGVGLSAYRIGVGAEYRLYAQELDIVHHDKSLLSPVFNVALGWRWDERLRALPGLDLSGKGPPRRYFWRLGFDLRQVFGQRKVEDKGRSNIFGIRLVAEREWGGIISTSNRLLLEADVNLSKLLMGNAISD